MDYLTIALVLMALGAAMLIAEVLVPTGGVLVVAALVFFALAVGVILYYGTTIEAVVAIGGLAVGLPASAFVMVAVWRRMSLDSALIDTPIDSQTVPAGTVSLKGRTGKTASPMRPSGSVEFDGKRVDAMTEGMMLDAGVWVRCVDVKGGKVIVRALESVPDVSDLEPNAEAPAPPPANEPKAPAPVSEQPKSEPPRRPRDDFDDIDIGLDKI